MKELKVFLGETKQDLTVDGLGRARVMVESPLGGDLQENLIYARLAMRDSLFEHKEAPMAFHLLYTQSLCDDNDNERKIGIFRSFVWHKEAEKKLFYLDRGFSNGMMLGYLNAVENGVLTEFRTLSSSDEMQVIVNELNAKVLLSKDELESVSLKFKDMMIINENLEIGIPGDVSSFRKEKSKEIGEVKECTELYSLSHPSRTNFKRLVMRRLLLDGQAPLNFKLLYSQFSKMNCKEVSSACNSWKSVADSSRLDEDFRSVVSDFKKEDIEKIVRLNSNEYVSQERNFNHNF